MKIVIRESADEASKIAADHIIERATPGMKLGVATGSSPLPLYKYLREARKAETFSLRGCTAWALDEYVGIAEDHPERYRNVLHRELVGDEATGLFDEDLHTPNGLAENPDAAAAEYDREIGAGVDIQILGVGQNGHIGFNEPLSSLSSRTHVDVLTDTTRQDNARFFENNMDLVPTQCITQGLGTIMSAKDIVVLAFGENKAEALHQLMEGGVSQRWPATILQHHSSVTVYADEAAVANLELLDYYRSTSG